VIAHDQQQIVAHLKERGLAVGGEMPGALDGFQQVVFCDAVLLAGIGAMDEILQRVGILDHQ